MRRTFAVLMCVAVFGCGGSGGSAGDPRPSAPVCGPLQVAQHEELGARLAALASVAGPTTTANARPFTSQNVADSPQPAALAQGAVVAALPVGAVGDGIADDTAAIQGALDAIAGTGQTLDLGSDTYRITSTLEVGSATRIIGSGAVLKPDATVNAPVLRAAGTAEARLSNVWVDGIRVDGVNRPDDSSGGFGALHFWYVDNLTVRDCAWDQVHDGVYLRAVQDFTLSGLRVNGARQAIVALLKGTRRGTISNLVGYEVDEIVDFYDNEDVTVSGFTATTSGSGAGENEAFDISTSRRILIASGIASGFEMGVRIKTEIGQTDPTYSWQDIAIENVTILEQALAGIHAQAAVASYGPASRLRVSNVTIVSSAPGASGVSLTPPASGAGGYDADFDGLLIDTPGRGFDSSAWNGLRLRNSVIRSAADYAAQLGSDGGTMLASAYVHDCEFVTTGASDVGAALAVTDAPDVRIENVKATANGGYGIWMQNCARPTIRGSEVAAAGMDGISVIWTRSAAFDPRRVATIACNVVRDWGQSSPFRGGIRVDVDNVSGSAEGLDVVGNTAVLSNDVMLDRQLAYVFDVGGISPVTYSRFDQNTAGGRVPTAFFGDAIFDGGTNSKTGNLPEP